MPWLAGIASPKSRILQVFRGMAEEFHREEFGTGPPNWHKRGSVVVDEAIATPPPHPAHPPIMSMEI